MVTRFGVSFDENLLSKFDSIIKVKGYHNRSQAIRDMVRAFVSQENEGRVVGHIMVRYDPREKSGNIFKIQNDYHCLIASASQQFLDHHNAMILMVVKGKEERIKSFIAKLKMQRCVNDISYTEMTA